MNVTLWCTRIIRLGFYLLFILVPLILTPWNYELFEFNKMVVVYALTAVIAGAWATKMVVEKEIRIVRTPLDIPIALFVLSQLISAIFSIDRHVSWFGYYSRFNGGMWSVFSYVLLYYAFVTHFTDVKRLLKVILGTAVVVALYGILERFGVDKHLWVQDVQSRVFSTLGQPNWLAAYLVALTPLAMAWGIAKMEGRKLEIDKKHIPSILYLLLSVLFFVVLLFTRSRSGLVGLALADAVFWTVLFRSMKKTNLRLPFALFHVLCFIVIFFNGSYIDQVDRWVSLKGWRDRITRREIPAPKAPAASGTALEFGGTESGTIRKYVWQGAVNAWRGSTKNLLIGTGTETFAFAFYQYRPAAHNLTSEWDFLYNKAHNEYLNYLATTGVFGLGSYLLLIGAFIFWFVKTQIVKVKPQPPDMRELNLGLFGGWLTVLVTNLFGFSVVVVQLLFFLIPAIVFATVGGYPQEIKKTLRLPHWAVWVPTVSGIYLLFSIGTYWQADTFFATGYRLARAGQFAAAQTADSKAINLKRNEPMYHDELSSALAALAVAAAGGEQATISANLAKRSLEENDRAIRTSPKNVNFWKTRTKIFYMLAALDPTLNQAAIEALLRAAALSPTDPKIDYNLAILYGRDGNYDKALEYLARAKELKGNYRDAYFGLYVFYTELKKPDLARAQLQEYLDTVDPTDQDFQDRLK